jgi:hypothetical protein
MTTSAPNKCGNPSCPLPKGSPPTNLLRCSRCRTARYCTKNCQAACWASHKRRCLRPNYILKFRLFPEHITDPPVERTLSCPAGAPFYALHLALQTVFGWATIHSFDFVVKDPAYVPPADLLPYINQVMEVDGSGGEKPASASREYFCCEWWIRCRGAGFQASIVIMRASAAILARWRRRAMIGICGSCWRSRSTRVGWGLAWSADVLSIS